jgi:hypothetical protein
MRRQDVLARVREIRPNEYQDEWALGLIDELEQRILRELMTGYLLPEAGEDLVAVPPYDGLYVDWIVAQIDLANGEYDRYNNDLMLFNARWDEYARYISRSYEREKRDVYRVW